MKQWIAARKAGYENSRAVSLGQLRLFTANFWHSREYAADSRPTNIQTSLGNCESFTGNCVIWWKLVKRSHIYRIYQRQCLSDETERIKVSVLLTSTSSKESLSSYFEDEFVRLAKPRLEIIHWRVKSKSFISENYCS